MSQPIEVIINAGSGSVEAEETKRQLTQLFEENGVDANIHLAKDGGEIVELAKKLSNGEAEIIVAGGGDGSVSAVAEEVLKADKILGVLPLGTLNNFSKDLQIPQEIEEAVRVIAERLVKTIDVGEVNGHIFVNNSSIGLYPQIVKRREKQQRLGHGKWRAAFWAALKLLKRSPFFAVRLETEKGTRIVKTPFVFVGNNEYTIDGTRLGSRERLDEGMLFVYLAPRTRARDLPLLLAKALVGRARQSGEFEIVRASDVWIDKSRSGRAQHVALDGEIRIINTPLHYQTRPGALRVVVPRS